MNTQDIIEYIIANIKQPIWENWYIKEKIGSGAFSAVFRAEAQRFDKVHSSALKIEPIVLSDSQAMANDEWKQHYLESKLQMVKNESAIMYKLRQCPNIVAYEEEDLRQLEINGRNEGYYFLIRMELLKNVCDMIKDRTFSFEEKNIIRLAKDIACGIKAAHDINIIHRDIKPSNFFMSDEGVYKLGDFNISKQTVSSNSFAGTEGYIAPEIYRARSNSQAGYTAQADIYSFGICLYQMMNNGLLPFEETNPTDDAITIRMQGTPLNPPAKASPVFSQIILRACAFEPSQRYATISEFISDIEKMEKDPTGTMTGMSFDSMRSIQPGQSFGGMMNQTQQSVYPQSQMPQSVYPQPQSVYPAAPVPQQIYPQPSVPPSSYPPPSVYQQPQYTQNDKDSGSAAKVFLILVTVLILVGAACAAVFFMFFYEKPDDDDDDSKHTSRNDAGYSVTTEAPETETEPETEPVSTVEPQTLPDAVSTEMQQTEEQTTTTTTTVTAATTTTTTVPVTDPPAQEILGPPIFTSVTASSYASPVQADGIWHYYEPFYATDNDPTSCWIEGAQDDGIGEYIQFDAPAPQKVTTINIMNGLCSNDDLYYKNGRVYECYIEFSDGSAVTVFLSGDKCGYIDVITLPHPVETTFVRFTIKVVYPGTKYKDTCISEISFE